MAIRWVHLGRYEIEPVSRIVRVLAPDCYLCGAAESEEADHIHPRARGGLDSWDNIGGACASCNASKNARLLTLTDGQAARLEGQRAAFRAAYGRITPAVAIEALAARARRRTPDPDPYGAQDDALARMRWLLFDEAEVPVDQGAPWLEAALLLMQERGWLSPVPDWTVADAVVEHVEYQREDDLANAEHAAEDGQHVNPVDRLDQLRAVGRDDEALALLAELIDEAERLAFMHGDPPASEWTKRAAVMLRRRGDRDGEIAVLRRYVAACPPGYGVRDLFDRLTKLIGERPDVAQLQDP